MTINDLPRGSSPDALSFGHFPTSFQAVIFRNWNTVPFERVAKVLGCSKDEVIASGRAMGLVPDEANCRIWDQRGFITTIRRNWHLLDYEQLLELLDWTPDQLAFTLKEDDFLYHKLGNLKPVCARVAYRTLTEEEKTQTAGMAESVQAMLRTLTSTSDPWSFLSKYDDISERIERKADGFGMRLAHSHSALYGDALLDPELDPYPEAMLRAYQKQGVNAVWLQGTLYTLIPWLGTDAFSDKADKRLASLRELVNRTAKYGIRIYLYTNEPRNMPNEFFDRYRPEWRGVPDNAGNCAVCTSAPGVLDALREGAARLFREVPGLGGLFTISMSENLTHCHSRIPGNQECPRCAGREVWQFPVEVNRALAEGVHSVAPDADVIAWTWAWQAEWVEQAVRALPLDVKVMCVSEWNLPTSVGGVAGKVIDYSISKVGPGDYARKVWAIAREAGLETVAKVQLNCTWEGAFVPFLPVPTLVEEHLNNLRREKVDHLMEAWTLGGYPGGNMPLADCSAEELAKKRYGKDAEKVLEAEKLFADGFREFPFNSTSLIYTGPQNYGPSALFYPEKTNYAASMIGYPYDDIKQWSGNHHYPEEVLEKQFQLLTERWQEGMDILEKIDGNSAVDELKIIAETCYCHYRSTYNHIRFVRRRNQGATAEIPAVLAEEKHLALRLMQLQQQDTRIGFESSNHYFYWINELLEKVLNCEHLSAQR